jgi:hypothetical protein
MSYACKVTIPCIDHVSGNSACVGRVQEFDACDTAGGQFDGTASDCPGYA